MFCPWGHDPLFLSNQDSNPNQGLSGFLSNQSIGFLNQTFDFNQSLVWIKQPFDYVAWTLTVPGMPCQEIKRGIGILRGMGFLGRDGGDRAPWHGQYPYRINTRLIDRIKRLIDGSGFGVKRLIDGMFDSRFN